MTTENKPETVDKEAEVVVETEVSKEPEYSEAELRALDKGWKPKEKWVEEGGDPNEWRSAKEFERTGEMLDHIHQQNRQIKSLRESFSALQRFHQNVEQRAYNSAIRSLKTERREAMREGEPDKVEQIEEQIEKTNEEFAKAQQNLQQTAQVQAEPDPAFTAWKDRNQWYNSDKLLKRAADGYGLAYFEDNPNSTPAEVLRFVETEIKKRHPEKFGERKTSPSPVARPDKTNSRGPGRPSSDEYQLNSQEKEVMETLIKGGHTTKEKYIAELKKYDEKFGKR